MIDTHAHLFTSEFEEDFEEMISRAKSAGVEKVLLPNIDECSIQALKDVVKKHPSFLIPMMGLHPTSINDDWQSQLSIIYEELNKNKYIAIGEIGIDLYWNKETLDKQKTVFQEQLKWSIEKQLPVSMHSRNALTEVINSIKYVGEDKIYGVFHSFGGNSLELEHVLSLKNFYVGINGVVTFKNSGLDEVIKNCPIERVVIETDSPWLAPTPNRGKRNESSFLAKIVEKLSHIYGISENEIVSQTTKNAYKIFNI